MCSPYSHLDLLSKLLIVDARSTSAVSAVGLVKTHGFLLHVCFSSVVLLLEHHFWLDGLKLGLEVANVVTMGAAVGATAGIGEGITVVVLFFARTAPRPTVSPVYYIL